MGYIVFCVVKQETAFEWRIWDWRSDGFSFDLLAQAIVQKARDQGLSLAPVEHFDSVTGMGVQGQVAGKQLFLGNTLLMSRAKADISELKPRAESLRAEGASVMYLAVDGTLAGILSVTDPIKESTVQTLTPMNPLVIQPTKAPGEALPTPRAE